MHTYSVEFYFILLFQKSCLTKPFTNVTKKKKRSEIPTFHFLKCYPVLGEELELFLPHSAGWPGPNDITYSCWQSDEWWDTWGCRWHWFEAIMRFSWTNSATTTYELHEIQVLRVLPSSSSAKKQLFLVCIMKENQQYFQLFCHIPSVLKTFQVRLKMV